LIRLKDQTEIAWNAFRVCEEYLCKEEATQIFNDNPRELNLCDIHMDQLKRKMFLS
jgi:hypothetical protein